MTVSVNVVLKDGKQHVPQMPFDQLDWLVQALLKLANGAYDRQIQAGKLSPANPIDPAMTVDAFRVLPDSRTRQALVQLTGRAEPKAPLGMGSFVLAAEQVQGLGERLLEVADQLRQSSRLS
jgi:hypothetical protein